MSQVLINKDLTDLAKLRQVGGTHRESVVREAFKDLLKAWGRSQDLTFIPEYGLDAEIDFKLRRGYPKTNIVFEGSTQAVLIQHGEEVMRCGVDDVAQLERLPKRLHLLRFGAFRTLQDSSITASIGSIPTGVKCARVAGGAACKVGARPRKLPLGLRMASAVVLLALLWQPVVEWRLLAWMR